MTFEQILNRFQKELNLGPSNKAIKFWRISAFPGDKHYHDDDLYFDCCFLLKNPKFFSVYKILDILFQALWQDYFFYVEEESRHGSARPYHITEFYILDKKGAKNKFTESDLERVISQSVNINEALLYAIKNDILNLTRKIRKLEEKKRRLENV